MTEWIEYEPLVLIVSDDRTERDAIRYALSGLGHLEAFGTRERAEERLLHGEVDLVVASSGEGEGAGLAERLGREHPETRFLLLVEEAEIGERAPSERGPELLVRPVADFQLRQSAAHILERRRLETENRQLRDRLHTERACRRLAPCLDAGKVYPLALDLLLAGLSRSRGFSLFRRDDSSLSDGVAFRGFSEVEARKLREALHEDKALALEGFQRVERVADGKLLDVLRSCDVQTQPLLAVPARGAEGEAGVMWILEDGRPFSGDEMEIASIVSERAAAALENAERYHQAKERAFVDDVTEVYNARYLMAQSERELRRAERFGSPLSVLFLDLDRFKLVNDRFGHLVGSQCLRDLSKLLLQCVRQVDTLARYGGDEFTILLADTAHDEAMSIARRIRRTVEEHVFEAVGDASLRLSISVGVATYPEHGTERGPLLDAADKAMYRAKSQGRNRVCSAVALSA